MKIDKELRAVLLSASKIAKNNGIDWEAKHQAEEASIEALLKKKPELKKKLAKAQELYKQAEKLTNEAAGLMDELGFSVANHGKRIRDIEAFRKAGGEFDELAGKEKMNYDRIIVELAAADPAELDTILAKYNIKWK